MSLAVDTIFLLLIHVVIENMAGFIEDFTLSALADKLGKSNCVQNVEIS